MPADGSGKLDMRDITRDNRHDEIYNNVVVEFSYRKVTGWDCWHVEYLHMHLLFPECPVFFFLMQWKLYFFHARNHICTFFIIFRLMTTQLCDSNVTHKAI